MAKYSFSTLTVALTAVVVSSAIAAAGLTIAQTGSESWSCDMNAGGEKGQGPTTCGGQGRPAWPDCVLFVCSTTGVGIGGGGSCSGSPPTTTSWCDNGAWRESGSTTGCPGSQPGAGYWCSGSTWMPPSGGGGCSGTPPTSMSWCDNGTWRESTGTGGSGGCGTEPNWPDCKTKTCSGSSWTCTEMYPTSGGGCPAPAFTDKPSCVAYCTQKNMGGCDWACDDFNPCGPGTGGGGDMPATCTACITAGGTQMSCPTCPGYTGGGGWTTSQMRSCMYPSAMKNGTPMTVWCERDYYNCKKGGPSGESIDLMNLQLGAPSTCESGWTGGGSGDCNRFTTGTREYRCCMNPGSSECTGGGDSGGKRWCFYPNATRDGKSLGYSVDCREGGDAASCYKGTHNQAGAVLEPATGLTLGSPSSCYSDSGTGGGDGGGQRWTCCPSDPMSKASCVTVGSGENPPAGYSCGGGGTGDGGGMGCRDIVAYRTCIGGATNNVRSDSALAMSCSDKHCGGYEGGGDGESCRRGCDDIVTRQKTSPTCTMKGYRPPWCTMSVESCKKGCPGGGGVIEPEGCRGTPPMSGVPQTCECVGKDWKCRPIEDRKPPEDYCKKYPNDEKCRKPEPRPVPVTGTLEEKLAALEEKIGVLEDQIEGLRNDLADAKDAVLEKNDEIRALKKSKAPRAEISAAQKELKELKRAVSAIVSKGKKLTRELKFRETEYDRLSRQVPPPYRAY